MCDYSYWLFNHLPALRIPLEHQSHWTIPLSPFNLGHALFGQNAFQNHESLAPRSPVSSVTCNFETHLQNILVSTYALYFLIIYIYIYITFLFFNNFLFTSRRIS